MLDPQDQATYAQAGVDAGTEEKAMAAFGAWIAKTFDLAEGHAEVSLPLGHFANVVDIGGGVGLALSCDSVGTKVLVAEMMRKYDTIGIDCIAMNVNDVLCIGARPVAFLDYIGVERADPWMLEELGKGLYEGAKMAGCSIPGGEIAQVKDLLKGVREGEACDLVGVCVGLVDPKKVITGAQIQEGDVVVGLASSGIHSNGFTLARKVLFERGGLSPDPVVPELGRSLGLELLEPTRIYAKPVMEMLDSGLQIKSMAHITSDGLTNLARIDSEFGFDIDTLPEPHPIFKLIQRVGNVTDPEMYDVFNMGVGYCLVIPPDQVDRAIRIAQNHGIDSYRLGTAKPDPEKTVALRPKGLVGRGSNFAKA